MKTKHPRIPEGAEWKNELSIVRKSTGISSSEMTNEKYYTPDITEFHVGFEYEFRGLDGYWNPTSYEKKVLKAKGENEFNGLAWLAEFDGDMKSFRVKYLDREDIESLDFEIKELENWIIEAIYKNDCTLKKIKVWFPKQATPSVEIYNTLGNITFSGICRNKSELKFLLRRTEPMFEKFK